MLPAESTSPIATPILSLVSGIAHEGALPKSPELDFNDKIQDDIAKLYQEWPKCPSNWSPGTGFHLFRLYAEQVGAEYKRCSSNAFACLKKFQNLKEEALSPWEAEPNFIYIRKIQEAIGNLTPSSGLVFGKSDQLEEFAGKIDIPSHEVAQALHLLIRATVISNYKSNKLNASLIDEYTKNASPALNENQGASRFILPDSNQEDPIKLRSYEVRIGSSERLQIPFELSTVSQAALIADWLKDLTQSHTPDAQLGEVTLRKIREQIQSTLEAGEPLAFSIFLSLEKFPAPLHTRNSNIDLGELRVVMELRNFVDRVQNLTGSAPHIILINETTVGTTFTNGRSDLYETQFRTLLADFGLHNAVEIKPMDEDFFVNSLVQAQGLSREKAREICIDSLKLLTECYHAILAKKLPDDLANALSFLSNKHPEETQRHGNQVVRFALRERKTILLDAEQGLRTEREAGVDLSLFLPSASQDLIVALGQSFQGKSEKECPEALRMCLNLAHDQGKEQGLTFKAIMRLRHLLRQEYDATVMKPSIIPLSITNAPEKLSISLGRERGAVLEIGNTPLYGVAPQHGVGVVVGDRIVSVEWQDIRLNREQFRKVILKFGHSSIEGYSYVPRAALCDLDGTLLAPGDKVVTGPVLQLIVSSITNGVPFGIVSGRSRESLNQLVLIPLVSYLKDNQIELSAEQDALFYFSGNNGAWSASGIASPQTIRESRIEISAFQKITGDTSLGKMMSMLSSGPQVDLGKLVPYYDDHCLYVEPEQVGHFLIEFGQGVGNIYLLAEDLNVELQRLNIPSTVLVNGKGLDFVPAGITKRTAVTDFVDYLADRTIVIRPKEILSIGDTPLGNDRELLEACIGVSDITKHGVNAVVNFVKKSIL